MTTLESKIDEFIEIFHTEVVPIIIKIDLPELENFKKMIYLIISSLPGTEHRRYFLQQVMMARQIFLLNKTKFPAIFYEKIELVLKTDKQDFEKICNDTFFSFLEYTEKLRLVHLNELALLERMENISSMVTEQENEEKNANVLSTIFLQSEEKILFKRICNREKEKLSKIIEDYSPSNIEKKMSYADLNIIIPKFYYLLNV